MLQVWRAFDPSARFNVEFAWRHQLWVRSVTRHKWSMLSRPKTVTSTPRSLDSLLIYSGSNGYSINNFQKIHFTILHIRKRSTHSGLKKICSKSDVLFYFIFFFENIMEKNWIYDWLLNFNLNNYTKPNIKEVRYLLICGVKGKLR